MSGIFGTSRTWKLPGILRRSPAVSDTDELNLALARAQTGLERKRRRWLLFLIEMEGRLLDRVAQTSQDTTREVFVSEAEEA